MRPARKIDTYYVKFRKKPNFILGMLFDTADSMKGAVIAVFFIFLLVVRVAGVSGSSMNPTLEDGDWVAVRSITTELSRGDVVIVTQPWEKDIPIIKRVIGIPGDIIDLNTETGELYVNGELQHEDYIADLTYVNFNARFPITVPEGRVFVMGDNRNNSLDSRSSKVGLVDQRFVLGKAFYRFYPNRKSLKEVKPNE